MSSLKFDESKSMIHRVLRYMWEYHPTPSDILNAREIYGKNRRVFRNRHVNGANPMMMLENGPLGFLAEIAISKMLDTQYVPNICHSRTPDVGGYDVRQSKPHHKYTPKLILREGETPERITILVIGNEEKMKAVGWIRNKDGMSTQYFTRNNTKRPPAYFIPQYILKPMGNLPR